MYDRVMRFWFWIFFLVVFFGGLTSFLMIDNRFEVLGELKPETPNVELIEQQDIEPQASLQNPPQTVKAVYATSWSMGSERKIEYFLKLIRETELNAIIIDIKDYTGHISYDTQNEAVLRYNTKDVRIRRVNALLKRLHSEGVYVIGRVSVFQDQALAKARPDLAVRDSRTATTWKDSKGLSWIDPSSREAWDYNASIAKDALARGFDEINFDYIRFPSDGNLSVLEFPFYDEKTVLKQTVMSNFFSYLNNYFGQARISGSIFGQTTVNTDDLGIGQLLEDAYRGFDFVSPMVYPSHYGKGFLNFQSPAEHPYEVVRYSLQVALRRSTPTEVEDYSSKLRPWLQDFDLGADYGADKVRGQIRAVEELGLTSGWMLWAPDNVYTREALNQ